MKNFGKKAKDKVTGFQGTVTSKHLYMYGCAQYGLQPSVGDDGKLGKKEYFDEGRIEIIKDFINPESVEADKNGCDHRERP